MCKIQFLDLYIVYTFAIQKVIQDIYWIDVYSITKSLIITNVVSSFQLDIKLYGKLKNNRKSNFCFFIPQNENGVNIFFFESHHKFIRFGRNQHDISSRSLDGRLFDNVFSVHHLGSLFYHT